MPRTVAPRYILDGRGAFAIESRVAITVFDVPEWKPETVDALYRETLSLAPAVPHTLVQQLGAEPGAAVRKRISERQRELETQDLYRGERRICVMSDSAVTRGMITAYRWLTQANILSYPESEIADGARWVVGPDGDAAAVERAYRACMGLIRRRPSRLP